MDEKKGYVMLWLSYECYFEPYSDDEVGRLVRAMMKYKSTGEEPNFTGNERYVWPAIKRDIDIATAAQEEKSRKNKINGSNGGRPKKANGFSENQENQSVILESEKSPCDIAPVILLPLNDGTEYPVTEEQCQEWSRLYPAVDVLQELRGMRGWLHANSSKRKTRRGIQRFINGWLAREQDKGAARNIREVPSRSDWHSTAQSAMDDLNELHQYFSEEG